jgi:DNA-directed RNA polymerase specialized sigma24 family protein
VGIVIRVPLQGRCEDCDLRDALTLSGRPKRHPQLGYDLSHGCRGCGGTGVSSKLVRLEVHALRLLTPKQRFVLERRLGTLDGRKYTQQEIAEAMGTSQQAVAKLEYWGRKRLLGVVK